MNESNGNDGRSYLQENDFLQMLQTALENTSMHSSMGELPLQFRVKCNAVLHVGTVSLFNIQTLCTDNCLTAITRAKAHATAYNPPFN